MRAWSASTAGPPPEPVSGSSCCWPTGARETFADEDGRFVFDQVPTGLAKFALHLPAGTESATVVSPTIEL